MSNIVWYKKCRRNTRKGSNLESVWIGKRIIVEVLEKSTYKGSMTFVYRDICVYCMCLEVQSKTGASLSTISLRSFDYNWQVVGIAGYSSIILG